MNTTELRILLPVVLLATALAFIITDLNSSLPHNGVRFYVKKFAFGLLTIGAYVGVNGLVAPSVAGR